LQANYENLCFSHEVGARNEKLFAVGQTIPKGIQAIGSTPGPFFLAREKQSWYKTTSEQTTSNLRIH